MIKEIESWIFKRGFILQIYELIHFYNQVYSLSHHTKTTFVRYKKLDPYEKHLIFRHRNGAKI